MAQVKFLKYEGEKIPYRISYLAISEWQKETGKGLNDLDEIDKDMSLLEPFFYHAVKTGYRVNKQEMPYSREGIIDVLDECLFEFMEGMGDFFQKGVKPKK
jgi:hypothetical protein